MSRLQPPGSSGVRVLPPEVGTHREFNRPDVALMRFNGVYQTPATLLAQVLRGNQRDTKHLDGSKGYHA